MRPGNRVTKAGLAVIVPTKNEEANIRACLESVAFADETIVVDSESADRTREIAERWKKG